MWLHCEEVESSRSLSFELEIFSTVSLFLCFISVMCSVSWNPRELDTREDTTLTVKQIEMNKRQEKKQETKTTNTVD